MQPSPCRNVPYRLVLRWSTNFVTFIAHGKLVPCSIELKNILCICNIASRKLWCANATFTMDKPRLKSGITLNLISKIIYVRTRHFIEIDYVQMHHFRLINLVSKIMGHAQTRQHRNPQARRDWPPLNTCCARIKLDLLNTISFLGPQLPTLNSNLFIAT